MLPILSFSPSKLLKHKHRFLPYSSIIRQHQHSCRTRSKVCIMFDQIRFLPWNMSVPRGQETPRPPDVGQLAQSPSPQPKAH